MCPAANSAIASSEYSTPLSPTAKQRPHVEQAELIRLDLANRMREIEAVQYIDESLIERIVETGRSIDRYLTRSRQNIFRLLSTKQADNELITLKYQLAKKLVIRWELKFIEPTKQFMLDHDALVKDYELIQEFVKVFPYSAMSQQLSRYANLLRVSDLSNPQYRIKDPYLIDHYQESCYQKTDDYIEAMYRLAAFYYEKPNPGRDKILTNMRLNLNYTLPLLEKAWLLTNRRADDPKLQHPSWNVPWWKFWRREHRDWRELMQARKYLEDALFAYITRAVRQGVFNDGDYKLLLKLMGCQDYSRSLSDYIANSRYRLANVCRHFIANGANAEACQKLLAFLFYHDWGYPIQHYYVMKKSAEQSAIVDFMKRVLTDRFGRGKAWLQKVLIPNLFESLLQPTEPTLQQNAKPGTVSKPKEKPDSVVGRLLEIGANTSSQATAAKTQRIEPMHHDADDSIQVLRP